MMFRVFSTVLIGVLAANAASAGPAFGSISSVCEDHPTRFTVSGEMHPAECDGRRVRLATRMSLDKLEGLCRRAGVDNLVGFVSNPNRDGGVDWACLSAPAE